MRSNKALLSGGAATGEPYELRWVAFERWAELGDKPSEEACVLELLGILLDWILNDV